MVKDKNLVKVFNIQRYSVHDGDGIRTNIFLKGCPLKCKWCSNPESQKFTFEKTFMKNSCMGCLMCVQLCPENALIEPSKRDEGKCKDCYKCIDICPTASHQLIGKEWRVEELVEEILKDYRFFKASGGGVTITGGEPLSQPVGAERLAAEIKKVGLSLAIETCGYAAWENAKKVFEHCDQILFDIKEIDPAKHKKFTGVDNALILSNARKAAKMDSQFVVRFPLIGGYNDTDENVLATAKFAAEIGADQVHLLPFHRFGENKYEKSNMIYDCDAYTPTDEQINRFMDMMREYGLDVKQGG